MKPLTKVRAAFYRWCGRSVARHRKQLSQQHGPRLMKAFYRQLRQQLIREGQDPQVVDDTIRLHQQLSDGQHARQMGDAYASQKLGSPRWFEIVHTDE